MPNPKNIHVVPHHDGWAVQRPHAERASSVHETQVQAEAAGRDLARRGHGEFFLHGRNGQIRERDSYGPDDYPPKG
jgi:hypothetical protein